MGTEAGDTTKNFAKAAGLDTPAGVMSGFDKFLTGMTQPRRFYKKYCAGRGEFRRRKNDRG